MRIVVYEKLGCAMFCDNSTELNNYCLPVTVVNANDEKLKVKVHVGSQTFTVNGNAIINATLEQFIEYAVDITYKGKRHHVGRIEPLCADNANLYATPDFFEKILSAAEKALDVAHTIETRISALEKAYNGVDILDLK